MAARREHLEREPGFAEWFESDEPGVHRADMVDYRYVVEGEIWLELDGGRRTHLHERDVVIQNATRHAWRNLTDSPTTMLVVRVGGDRP